MVQDAEGFIWLGTRDGLVKYDGHTPVVYTAGEGGIPFNYVYDLHLDRDNQLWMASNADYKGAAYLDLSDGTFKHITKENYPGLSNNGVVVVDRDSDGRIALLTKDFHLNLLDLESSKIRTWNLSQHLPDKRTVVNAVDMISDPVSPGAFWISTVEGIFRFDTKKEEFTDLLFTEGWSPVEFFIDTVNIPYVWVSLHFQGGLLRINLKNPSEKTFYGLKGEFSVKDRLDTHNHDVFFVHNIARKSNHEFYIATGNRGVGVFNLTTGHFDFEEHQTDVLNTDYIRSLYANKNGECWIGTDKAGLFYLRPDIAHLQLKLFREATEERSEFRLEDITSLREDKYLLGFFRYPEIWIWDREEDLYDKIRFSNETLDVKSIVRRHDDILLATNQSLKTFDLDTRKISLPKISLPPEVTYTRIVDQDTSGLWIIAWGYGIINYKDTVRLYPGAISPDGLKHRWTHDLAFGPDGKVWVGQQNGLYSIDKVSGDVQAYAHADALNGFKNPNLKAITFDHSQRLWVGNFGSGLVCFDIHSKKVLHTYSASTGLPSDRIYDLITDNNGYIWVWTSNGLCSFFPEEEVSNVNFKYYPDTKFLPVDMEGVWFKKMDNGEIFFGVSGGFAHFDPQSLRNNEHPELTPPVLTGFKVFDQELGLNKTRADNGMLQLKPGQNFFTISFSAPESGFISRQQFHYRLEGVDNDWVNSGNNRTAVYTDIRPGKYQFVTRVGDQNGSWSRPSQPLTIFLAAPWYATGVAKGFWALLFLGILFGMNRILVMRERMRSQIAVQQLEADSLREMDATKSNFFNQISHEFRTPLTVILGMADQLRNKKHEQGLIKNSLDAIERNGKLLLKQINQILDLSKLQTKTVELEMVYGDVVPYLRYLTEAFYAFASSKNINLEFDHRKSVIDMDHDPERLKDIYVNLLSNALKFTNEKGKITVEVDIYKKDGKPYFHLEVSDTGNGIAQDDLIQIFEPYYQGDSLKKSQGTGLGLATAQQWVQAMGGQIEARSQKGIGTTMTVVIPITQLAERKKVAFTGADMTISLPSAKSSSRSLPSGDSIILVIEDNDGVVDYLTLCLEGYQIMRAIDGEEGIQMAIEQVPDLIITDVMMPQKDGYEVCAILREQEATSHIPIIMLTAKATQEEKKTGLSLGADAYLIKPFDQEELLIRTKGLLGQRRLLQEKYSQLQDHEVHKQAMEDQEGQFLDRIQKSVEARLMKDFSVEDLAKEMGMSRVQLYRKVKALTGTSISIYIRLIRLYKGRQWLRSTNKTIAEIAYETGFTDPSYFTKAFKEAFDVTPSEIRKS
jgi:signal transduction histidine kinase/DNA-binding response OmpR family regulator/ligand-binding sensor domain-containing protein